MDGQTHLGSEDEARRSAKARLFGEESDRLRKRLAKARFLRELVSPMTGGEETGALSEDATQPRVSDGSLGAARADRADRIDRFVVLRKLGEGGMGVVYAAFDEQLDRKVALKLLRGDLVEDPRGRVRMLREAQALARLSHPNVVQVHEIGRWLEHDFLAMEFVEGETLSNWVGALPDRDWRVILEVMTQAGRGLAAAHAAGIVHRDFKPANLLVGTDGRPRVIDFGLARAAEEPLGTRSDPEGEGYPALADALSTIEQSGAKSARSLDDADELAAAADSTTMGAAADLRARADSSGSGSASASGSALDRLLTVTGAVLGTPAYMAPEQHLGQRASESSDIYSFCVVLYEALFGERPHKATSRTEYAMRVAEGDFTVPGPESGVPRWLRDAVCRGLAPKPQERWPSMDVLLDELTRDRQRRGTWVGLAAGMAASLGVALALAGGTAAPPAPELCRFDRDSVASTWGDEQRAELREAFSGTGLAAAAAASARAEAEFDAYADALVAGRQTACGDRWLTQVQTDAQLELRMACLDQREAELGAALEILSEPGGRALGRASQVLAGLGDVGMCARVEILERHTPVPKDELAVAGIAAARAELARAAAAREASLMDEARAATASVRRDADRLDYLPLLAEVSYEEGLETARAMDYSGALAKLIEATKLATRANHLELQADVALALARVELLLRRDAELPLALAEAAVERLGEPAALRFRLHFIRGLALEHRGDAEAALAEFDAAKAASEGLPGADHRVASVLTQRARILAALGDSTGARAELAQVQALASLEPDHIEVLNATFDLGVVELEAGELDDAERDISAALAGFNRVFGPRYAQIGHGRLALAQVTMLRGDLDAAVSQAELALEVFEPGSLDEAYGLGAVAALAMMAERSEDAVEPLQRAIASVQRNSPEDRAYLGYLEGRLGTALATVGRSAAALEAFDRAILALDVEPQPIDLADPLIGRAALRRSLGRPDLALTTLERAVALVPLDCGNLDLIAHARVELALTLAALERHEAATELAREVAALLDGQDGFETYLTEIEPLLMD